MPLMRDGTNIQGRYSANALQWMLDGWVCWGFCKGPPMAQVDPAFPGPKDCKLRKEELVSYQSKSQSIAGSWCCCFDWRCATEFKCHFSGKRDQQNWLSLSADQKYLTFHGPGMLRDGPEKWLTTFKKRLITGRLQLIADYFSKHGKPRRTSVPPDTRFQGP